MYITCTSLLIGEVTLSLCKKSCDGQTETLIFISDFAAV